MTGLAGRQNHKQFYRTKGKHLQTLQSSKGSFIIYWMGAATLHLPHGKKPPLSNMSKAILIVLLGKISVGGQKFSMTYEGCEKHFDSF